jgi:G3E family GTPase
LISSDVVQDVRDWLGLANPKAQVVATAQGRLPPAVILGVEMVAGQPQASAHADAGYESRVFSEIPPCDPIKLAKALATGAVGIIRAKGFVADQAGQNWLIQIVGERFDVTLSKAKEHIAVVCIGRKGALETGAIGVMFAGDAG